MNKSLKKTWEICKKLDKMLIGGWGTVEKIQQESEKSNNFK